MSEGDVAVTWTLHWTEPSSNLPAILRRAGFRLIHPAVLVFRSPSVYFFCLPIFMPPRDPGRLTLFDSSVRDSAGAARHKAGAILVLPVVDIIITSPALHVLRYES